MKISTIKTASEFVHEIELLVREKQIEYFDAVLLYCERHGLEVETAAAFVKQSQTLKSKIQIEAENINMMKKTARLPI